MKKYPEPNTGITPFGYRRVQTKNRKLKFEHVLVWEANNGPVPNGMELHHINRIKLDNRIENLQIVTRLEHKRIHSGCELRNGAWFKPCRRCEIMQSVDNFYKKPDGISHICKTCAISLAVHHKKLRKQRARIQAVIKQTGGLKNDCLTEGDKKIANGQEYTEKTPVRTEACTAEVV